MMIRRALFLAIFLSTLSLVLAFVLSGAVSAVVVSLLLGVSWAVLEGLQKDWFAPWGLVCMVVLAIFGAMQEYYAFLYAIAIAAALSAWDLSRFRLRLIPVERDGTRLVARRHLQRLLLVNSVGLILSILAINLRFGGSFYLEWLLGLIMLFLLFAFVIWLVRLTR